MKITCHECESELEIIDLHDDGSEILVKLCKSCLGDIGSTAYDSGYQAGQDDCPCSEEDYQEGYNEAEEYYQEKIDRLEDKISDLEDKITELKENAND